MSNNALFDSVMKAYNAHRKVFEHWEHGKPCQWWTDADGYLCIKYDSGQWWHYSGIDTNNIEWW